MKFHHHAWVKVPDSESFETYGKTWVRRCCGQRMQRGAESYKVVCAETECLKEEIRYGLDGWVCLVCGGIELNHPSPPDGCFV